MFQSKPHERNHKTHIRKRAKSQESQTQKRYHDIRKSVIVKTKETKKK